MKARTLLLWNTTVAVSLEIVRWLGETGRNSLQRVGRWIARRTRPLWNPLWQRYRIWPKFRQHFAVSLVLGIAIELGVHFFGHGLATVEEWQRWARDKTIALTRLYYQEGWIDAKALPGGFSRFVLIDVDNATWQNEAWGGGEPFVQPREQVFALIDRAFESGARVVYLDLLLDGRFGDLERAWLKKLSNKTYATPRELLVARSLRQPLDQGALPQVRPAFWDTYGGRPNGITIHPVLPNYPLSIDLRVREWHIGQMAKTPDRSASRFYPSPQLAIYCLRSDSPAGAAHTGLIPWCSKINEVVDAEHTDTLEAQHHDALASTMLFPMGAEAKHRGYSPWPALFVLQSEEPIDDLRDSIAVIGATYPETRDEYHTPVGKQAGAIINLNAMDTMLRHGYLHELPWHTKWPLALVIIGAVAAIFAIGKRLAAVVAATALVFLVFAFLIGPWLLLHGLWFDFGAPLLGIQLHRSIEEFLDGRKQSRARKPIPSS